MSCKDCKWWTADVECSDTGQCHSDESWWEHQWRQAWDTCEEYTPRPEVPPGCGAGGDEG